MPRWAKRWRSLCDTGTVFLVTRSWREKLYSLWRSVVSSLESKTAGSLSDSNEPGASARHCLRRWVPEKSLSVSHSLTPKKASIKISEKRKTKVRKKEHQPLCGSTSDPRGSSPSFAAASMRASVYFQSSGGPF